MRILICLGGILATAILTAVAQTSPLVKQAWPIYLMCGILIWLVVDYLQMSIKDKQNRFYQKMWLDEVKHNSELHSKLIDLQKEDGEEWKEQ